ncbi:hypothetical protein CISG_10120 [Coccidioides immitis RMSCC 3703]|uniref:Uncharacterized protein n=1 Tax=Coccidioides immitis RMSCC 3703 TaxID=454286 RepID=A0A0J8QMJ2_COCIT|nr:hypothetical protein CISG_10120 [Coccidioides immitis RMSCC 3703]
MHPRGSAPDDSNPPQIASEDTAAPVHERISPSLGLVDAACMNTRIKCLLAFLENRDSTEVSSEAHRGAIKNSLEEGKEKQKASGLVHSSILSESGISGVGEMNV